MSVLEHSNFLCCNLLESLILLSLMNNKWAFGAVGGKTFLGDFSRDVFIDCCRNFRIVIYPFISIVRITASFDTEREQVFFSFFDRNIETGINIFKTGDTSKSNTAVHFFLAFQAENLRNPLPVFNYGLHSGKAYVLRSPVKASEFIIGKSCSPNPVVFPPINYNTWNLRPFLSSPNRTRLAPQLLIRSQSPGARDYFKLPGFFVVHDDRPNHNWIDGAELLDVSRKGGDVFWGCRTEFTCRRSACSSSPWSPCPQLWPISLSSILSVGEGHIASVVGLKNGGSPWPSL